MKPELFINRNPAAFLSVSRWNSMETSSSTGFRAAVRSTSPTWLLAASRYVQQLTNTEPESYDIL